MTSEALSCGDLLLWERYTDKEKKPDGSLVLTLVEGAMPDGKPCQATLAPGWKPRVAVEQWYQYVKGEASAREAKQEAEAAKRAEASGAGGGGNDPAPRVYGGSEVPTPAAVQARKASVEELIQSEIADRGRSIARIEEQIEATEVVLRTLRTDLEYERKQRHRAIAAVKALKEADHAA